MIRRILNTSKNLLLVNDCSHNRHFGSQLVTEAFAVNAMQRDYSMRTLPRGELPDEVDLAFADVVIVNAEGCIHDGKHEGLLTIGERHPNAYLMNGSMQNLSRNFADELGHFKDVTVRESCTEEELMAHHILFPDVVPDVIFSLPMEKPRRRYNSELFISDSSDRQFQKERTCSATDPSFLEHLAHSKVACVGRFHAAVFCAKWGIPFSAFGGNTHKLKGLMEDMGIPDRYYETAEEAKASIPSNVPDSVEEYVRWAKGRIRNRFDVILP